MNLPRARHALVGIGLLLALWSFSCATQPRAATRRAPVTNEYHGVRVREDFQWLENAESPDVKEWSAAQNRSTREYLDKLPVRARLQEDLTEILDNVSVRYSQLQVRTGTVFALQYRPSAQQPRLVALRTIHRPSPEEVILDPNKLNTNGTTAIDFFTPSRDAKLVAVSMSEKGSEEGTLHVYDRKNAKPLTDVIPRVQFPTAGGSVTWNADGSGFYYTRYPAPGEKPAGDLQFYQQIYFHKLETPTSEDRYELGRDFPKIAETQLETSPDGRFILATVANGDGGDFAHYLRLQDGNWRQLTKFTDGVKRMFFGKKDALYALTLQGAPKGRILKLSIENPDMAAATPFIPEGDGVIVDLETTSAGVYLNELVGGPSRIRFFNTEGTYLKTIETKAVSAVHGMFNLRDDLLVFANEGYLDPSAWYETESKSNKVSKTILETKSPVDFGDAEVVREFATSKDGTKIPLNLIRKKGVIKDRSNPVLLTGYGGYGISREPRFDPTLRVWLDAGGIFAVANLRGGGEFGEAWHKAGALTNKQNVFDDFAACAGHLVSEGYTKPSKLAVEGGSNGGLLMGAFLTQNPDMATAVVSHVGIYDMLRVELDPNGAFNVTEFGTVKDPDQFRALLGYSPYHHVKKGTAYPAVLFMTGEHDGRVNPAHSRKMTAALQANGRASKPVYLRTSADTGHGMGSSTASLIAEKTDSLAFLMDQLHADLTHWLSPSIVERGPVSGAVTPTGAIVKVKLSAGAARVRLRLSVDAALSHPILSRYENPATNEFRMVAFTVTNLIPATDYYYAAEVDGRVQRDKAGHFRTFPDGAASFAFAYGSCAKTGSTNPVFDTIRGLNPLFFMNDGDFHYENISRNATWRYRRAYDKVFGSKPQGDLYRSTPLVYIWDDHDFGGNDSNGKSPAHPAARMSYESYIPHYPLVAGDGDVPIYQTFTVGRVKFILTDLRSERDAAEARDDAKKTMMGAKQKEWFKRELLSSNGKYPLIFWVSSVPWIGTAGSNYYRLGTNSYGLIFHNSRTNVPPEPARTNRAPRPRFPFNEDSWSVFGTERREIANFIKDNHIKGLAILHGDAHMLAADDGSHSDYATGGGAPIPVMAAAPLDQDPSIKGGPYSQGVYRHVKGEGCFGYVTVEDRGGEIAVRYSGRNHLNEEKLSLTFTVPAQ